MITFKRGDTFRFLVDLYDQVAAAPVDLTGATAVCKMRSAREGTLIGTLSATVAPSPAGVLELLASSAQTAAWALGDALLDVRVTLASGDVITTPNAPFRIEEAASA